MRKGADAQETGDIDVIVGSSEGVGPAGICHAAGRAAGVLASLRLASGSAQAVPGGIRCRWGPVRDPAGRVGGSLDGGWENAWPSGVGLPSHLPSLMPDAGRRLLLPLLPLNYNKRLLSSSSPTANPRSFSLRSLITTCLFPSVFSSFLPESDEVLSRRRPARCSLGICS